MVKEYRRSSADQKEPAAGDLRTPEALSRTMDYLVCNIMDDPRSNTHELALEWYDFLWDRLRAIRKDITQQNICDQASATLVERCARFHVHSCYAMNQVKNFDVNMNKRNLNDCLQMLRQMYSDLRMTSGIICPGELEFQIYDILLHLDEDHLASTVQMKTSDYRSTSEMKFILNIVIAYTNNDYHKFFRLMESANYMTSCLLSLYSNRMRLIGLKSIINACSPRQTTLYPFELAINLLGFDDKEDLKSFASQLDIEVQEKDQECFLCLNRELIQTLRRSETPSRIHFKSRHLVEDKAKGLPVGLLVDGRDKLPDNPYRANPIVFQQPISNNVQNENEQTPSMEIQEEKDAPEEVKLNTFTFNCDRSSPPKIQTQWQMPVQSHSSSPVSLKSTNSTIYSHSYSHSHSHSHAHAHAHSPKLPPPSPPTSVSNSSPTTLSIPTPSSPKKPEQQNLEVVEVHETNEPQECPQTISAPCSEDDALKRKLELEAREKEIADIMPVGPYKIRSLKAKVPTLRLPSMSNGNPIPIKRPKPMNSPRRRLETMSVDLGDESRANEMFLQIVGDLNNVKTLIL
jgi:hypothetical protein